MKIIRSKPVETVLLQRDRWSSLAEMVLQGQKKKRDIFHRHVTAMWVSFQCVESKCSALTHDRCHYLRVSCCQYAVGKVHDYSLTN